MSTELIFSFGCLSLKPGEEADIEAIVPLIRGKVWLRDIVMSSASDKLACFGHPHLDGREVYVRPIFDPMFGRCEFVDHPRVKSLQKLTWRIRNTSEQMLKISMVVRAVEKDAS